MQSISSILGKWMASRRVRIVLATITVVAIPIGFLGKNPDYNKSLLNTTNYLKKGLQDIQVAEHFVRYVFGWPPTRGDCDEYGVSSLQPAGCRLTIVGLIARVPGALVYTTQKVWTSGLPGIVFGLVALLFTFAGWYSEPERSLKDFLLIPLYAILLAWLFKLLILGVLSVFGWVIQLIVLLTLPMAGVLKALEFMEMSKKLREATAALGDVHRQKG